MLMSHVAILTGGFPLFLMNVAATFFSFSWRIREPSGCADLRALFARDRAVEAWLQTEAAAAYDASSSSKKCRFSNSVS